MVENHRASNHPAKQGKQPFFEAVLAEEEMAAEVARLNVASWQHAYKGLLPQEYLADITVESRTEPIARMIHTGEAEYYLFRVDGQNAGMAALCPSRDEDANDTVGEVAAIYFLPEFWGQGHALEAMAFCMRRLEQQGYESAVVWVLRDNLRARFFYEKMGLVYDCEKKFDFGGEVLCVRYRIALTPREEG